MRVSIAKITAGLALAILLLEAGLRLGPGRTAREGVLLVGDSHAAGLAKGLSGKISLTDATKAGENSEELLEKLPSLLERMHPRVLVVMSGEANFWNRHLMLRFLDHRAGVLDFFARSRLIGLLLQRPKEHRRFPEVPLSEYPTLAMRWVGYLNANPPPPEHENEAINSLERWLADPRSKPSLTATRILGELRGRTERRMAAPTLLRSYRREPRDVFLRGLRDNPFYAGGELPAFPEDGSLSQPEFIAAFAAALPPPASGSGLKPGLASLRESLAGEADLQAWAFHDLAEIVRLARERHVPVLLATYPPDRFSANGRAVDTVIRQAAVSLETPLSDISSELNRRWGKSDRSAFYATAAVDELSDAGDRLAAGILLEDLRRRFDSGGNAE